MLLSSRMKCFALFFQFLIQADASCKLCFLSGGKQPSFTSQQNGHISLDKKSPEWRYIFSIFYTIKRTESNTNRFKAIFFSASIYRTEFVVLSIYLLTHDSSYKIKINSCCAFSIGISGAQV